ncbi:MAG: hypothetical protein M5U31_05185 [Acidimicrobiia bacterium]|nr:hypothetical protein [Acidimicrobiia bacterium]
MNTPLPGTRAQRLPRLWATGAGVGCVGCGAGTTDGLGAAELATPDADGLAPLEPLGADRRTTTRTRREGGGVASAVGRDDSTAVDTGADAALPPVWVSPRNATIPSALAALAPATRIRERAAKRRRRRARARRSSSDGRVAGGGACPEASVVIVTTPVLLGLVSVVLVVVLVISVVVVLEMVVLEMVVVGGGRARGRGDLRSCRTLGEGAAADPGSSTITVSISGGAVVVAESVFTTGLSSPTLPFPAESSRPTFAATAAVPASTVAVMAPAAARIFLRSIMFSSVAHSTP